MCSELTTLPLLLGEENQTNQNPYWILFQGHKAYSQIQLKWFPEVSNSDFYLARSYSQLLRRVDSIRLVGRIHRDGADGATNGLLHSWPGHLSQRRRPPELESGSQCREA